MSTETYAIVFKGGIVEGHEAAAVQAQLAKLLKLDAKKVSALFSGKQIVLKKTADKAEAAKYGKVLKKAGADVKIRVIKTDAPAPKPVAPAFQKAETPVFQAADDAPPPAFQKAEEESPPAPAAKAEPTTQEKPTEAEAPTVDTSGISLAPNEGDLFDSQPEVESPELDLSEYDLAENDGSLLVEPAEEVVVELDLSDFSVAENDGSDLFEAQEEDTPEIDVPDFGLDEPGAVLDTIQEEKELLNPNTMGMTLAMTGSDMLEEDEKPPAPTPKEPDTSAINLVPNFD
ncbi:MAG: hypothetical protein HOC70_10915 [Gammaproteobacteria bacterium]|jgi:hypothetical protein|nr:hypothetical protein [Gammaproteobacteria bacterium]MBT4493745.1 hypothetical protein [Gammaproteobacteria bacterium]MBT7371690.1 hypothetical protein [Gammaproteobacteria bacterium]